MFFEESYPIRACRLTRIQGLQGSALNLHSLVPRIFSSLLLQQTALLAGIQTSYASYRLTRNSESTRQQSRTPRTTQDGNKLQTRHQTRSAQCFIMSGLKNSPFGKRLRASHQDTDDDAPRRNRPRINPIFGLTPKAVVASASTSTSTLPSALPSPSSTLSTLPISTPSLDDSQSQPTTSDSSSGGPESPIDLHFPRIVAPPPPRDYGDRFVPSRDAGDMRTSYHLMDEGGPSTPSKNRIIPSESDALKGVFKPDPHY